MGKRKGWQCNLCNRSFRSTRAFFTHCRDKADHPFCEDCQTLFYNFAGLYQHRNEVHGSALGSDDDEDDGDGEEPPFCVGCNRWFVDLASLYQHLATSLKHNWCFLCSREFATPTSLDQHSSPVHKGLDFECPLCSKRFMTPSSIAPHIQSGTCHNSSRAQVITAVHALKTVPTISVSRHIEGGSTHVVSDEYAFESDNDEDDDDGEEPPFCVGCNRWFVDLANLHQHLATSLKHNWCFLCSRDFATPTSLDQHSSPVHKGLDFECPLCSERFKIPSSIALHIQSGACHNISRAQVTAAVHALNIVPSISVSRHIEGGSTRVASYYVTERAFNGTAYECYLCHLTFRTLGALNSHINSPAHDADEFKCPKCERKYKFVSGLMQHIESEACGVPRFEVVEDFTMSLIDQLL